MYMNLESFTPESVVRLKRRRALKRKKLQAERELKVAAKRAREALERDATAPEVLNAIGYFNALADRFNDAHPSYQNAPEGALVTSPNNVY